jgi:hypothetical protein
LSEAQATVSAWGGTLYFVYVPSYGLLKYRGKLPLYRFALDTASSQGLPIIDLYPVFQAQPEPLALFPFPYSHYSPAGYRVAAQGILNHLN